MKQKDRKARLREIRKADKAGHTATVLALAKRLVVEFPDYIMGWYYLGTSLAAVARYEEALQALRRVSRLLPPKKQHPVQIEFGHLYRQKGDLRRAEAWYRKAIKSDPVDAKYYIYLGALLARSGRLAEAEAAHRKATRCRDGCIDEAYLNLGFVLRAQARYREAGACFKKALDLSPKYPQAKKALEDVQQVLRMKTTIP